MPLTIDANYESFCVSAYINGEVELENSDFANNPGAGIDWTTGASPNVIGTILSASDTLWVDYNFIDGISYSITIVFNSSANIVGTLAVRILNGSFTIQYSGSTSSINTGSNTATDIVTFTANTSTTRIGIQIDFGTGGTVTLTSMLVTVNELLITEEICIDILETCESIDQFTQESIRLLEDGGYRLLE